MNEPKVFILEMVWKFSVRKHFLEVIRRTCPNYAIWSGVLNSSKLAPTSRTRFYIIGVNVTKVVSNKFHPMLHYNIIQNHTSSISGRFSFLLLALVSHTFPTGLHYMYVYSNHSNILQRGMDSRSGRKF